MFEAMCRPLNGAPGIELVLRCGSTPQKNGLDRVRGKLYRDGELLAFGPSGAREDVTDTAVLAARWLADPDPHPEELVGSQPGLYGAEAVVPCQPSPDLHPDHPGGQVELVVDDDEPGHVSNLVAPDERRDGAAGLVHVGLREGERQAPSLYTDFGDVRQLLARPQPVAMTTSQHCHHVSTDVVARTGVLGPWVAQANSKQVYRGRALGLITAEQAGSALPGLADNALRRLGARTLASNLRAGSHCRGSRYDDGLVGVDIGAYASR